MSGTLQLTTNKYASIDVTVASEDGVAQLPFRVTRLLDIIRNDGPGEAEITLEGGAAIPLLAGDYVGPWAYFHSSTITVQCLTEGKSCRVRAIGV